MGIIRTSYCGISCPECVIYIATKENNVKLKTQIAEKQNKEYGINYTIEDVFCLGCKTDLKHVYYCDEICEIRKCASKEKVITCAHCKNYPCSIFNNKEYDFAKELLDKMKEEF